MQHCQRILQAWSKLLLIFLLSAAMVACSATRPILPSKQDLKVVATCAGYDVYYDEFRYVVMTYKDAYKNKYGSTVWTDATLAAQYLPMLWEDVSESLKTNYAILSMGAEFGIDIQDDTVQEQVQASVAEQIEALGGRQLYAQLLKYSYMTDRFVRFTVGADVCESQLSYAMITAGLMIANEKDFIPYAMDDGNMCATYHVFIGNDAGDDVEQNRLAAEQVRNMLLTGTDIKSLIGSTYNEDIYAPSTPYYFMRTEYEQAYEDAAFSLEIGGISEVVESEDGFYVIVRQPLSEAYVLSHVTELLQRYQYAQVEGLLAEHRKSITIEWNDYAKSIDLPAME